MFHAECYMQQLTELLKIRFEERLVYVGLQGSYMRGEAAERSDIDPMVIIDDLTVDDLYEYRNIIYALEEPDKSCGFICGKQELARWNPLEICHLLNSTRDIYGKLASLVPAYTDRDVRNFAKLSVNNLYHEICHRYVHSSAERNAAKIAGSFKSVFFILQNTHYLDTGVFVPTKKELLMQLSGKDAEVLRTSMEIDSGMLFEFSWLFDLLFSWCSEVILRF